MQSKNSPSQNGPSKTAQSGGTLLIVGVMLFVLIAAGLLSLAAINKNRGREAQTDPSVIYSSPHSYSKEVKAGGKVALGTEVPDFQLEDVNTVAAAGAPAVQWKLSDLRGHLTVLFFADLECPCVKAYNDRMKALQAKYSPDGLRVAYVYSAPGESAQAIREQAATAGYPWPCVRDTDQKLMRTLNVQCTTEVFLLDEEGKLRYHGRVDDSVFEPKVVKAPDLENAIQDLLGKRPVKVAETKTYACTITRVQGKPLGKKPVVKPKTPA